MIADSDRRRHARFRYRTPDCYSMRVVRERAGVLRRKPNQTQRLLDWLRACKPGEDRVERVTGEAAMTKHAVKTMVGTAVASIAQARARGEDVTVTGFGSVSRRRRPTRAGAGIRGPANASP